jgi:hypothetical protein
MSSESAASRRGQLVSLAVFICSVLTSLALLGFFVIGIVDGSVSDFNIGLWLLLLAGACLSLWAGHALRRRRRFGLANAALAVTAIPGLLAALFVLAVLVTQPRWN